MGQQLYTLYGGNFNSGGDSGCPPRSLQSFMVCVDSEHQFLKKNYFHAYGLYFIQSGVEGRTMSLGFGKQSR